MAVFSMKKARAIFLGTIIITSTMMNSVSAFGINETNNKIEYKSISIYDGDKKIPFKTNESDYRKVLDAAGIKLSSYDKFWSSSGNLEDGSVLVIERAIPVKINYKGSIRVIYTTQQTVQGVVNDAGYDWHKVMPVEDGLSRVRSGMEIHVIPYEVKIVEKTEEIPVSYVKWYDSTLNSDEQVVVQEGRTGIRNTRVEEFISDGKVIKTEVLKSKVIDEGEKGIAKTGNQNGTVGWVKVMSATAYHPMDGDGRGITATGTRAGHGVVAVDPSVIPLGSKVYVPGYGEAVAEDTGGAIIGDRIDLCMDTYYDCYAFGRKNIEVFVQY